MRRTGYNVYYNNNTGKVVYKKNIKDDTEFDKKVEELYKFANIDDPKKVNIEKNAIPCSGNYCMDYTDGDNQQNKKIYEKEDIIDLIKNTFNKNNYDKNKIKSLIKENIERRDNINYHNSDLINEQLVPQSLHGQQEQQEHQTLHGQQGHQSLQGQQTLHRQQTNSKIESLIAKKIISEHNLNEDLIIKDIHTKKNLLYGIKKTILSDLNHLNYSSNSNDFKIGLNKNNKSDNNIFDSFYLFPNISEINTKTETNIINEKKVRVFKNINDSSDIQYFPTDFIACGITIPFKTSVKSFTKIKITNIFWNIFQSINNNSTDLLCTVLDKNDFIYNKIKLQINFEFHSQVNKNVQLPYRSCSDTETDKNISPSNSCLFKVLSFNIDTLNGSNFNNLEIDLTSIPKEANIHCSLLCVRISIPSESFEILKGCDKNNKIFCGYVPFSQFILNFDYEIF